MSIRILLSLTVLIASPVVAEGRAVAAAGLSAARILELAGLAPAQRARLQAGQVVAGDRDDLGDEALSILLLKRVELSVTDSHEALGRAIAAQNATIGARVLPIRDGSFPRVGLGESAFRRLRSFRGGDAFNLGGSETRALLRLVVGGEGGVREIEREQLRAWLQDTVERRYAAYRSGGLDGVEPYQRDDGLDEPATSFDHLDRGTDIPCPGFDRLCRQLASHRQAVDGIRHEYWLAERTVDGREHLSLVHRVLDERPEFVVAVEREFYSLHTFSLQQFSFVIVPAGAGVSLVAIVADTFTHRVSGVGGNLTRWLGRRILREQVSDLLEPLPGSAE